MFSLVRNVILGTVIYIVSTLVMNSFNKEEQTMFKLAFEKIKQKV